jgi:hypothetical protein
MTELVKARDDQTRALSFFRTFLAIIFVRQEKGFGGHSSW